MAATTHTSHVIGKLMPMLYVRDVLRSVEFYRDRLGFKFTGWWNDDTNDYSQELRGKEKPQFAELRVGDLVLHLHAAEGELPKKEGASILHLAVDDVDAYHAEVQARGIKADPPEDMPWGMRHFYVSDPDGQAWSFSQPVRGK
ncbi:MAG TPA: VOC family protein [Planctomycetota bacterium]|nr:VOC family protein [Planctomycetota bacterium]